jgi:type II secretory pathway predicted ATPase ExeA
MEGGILRSWTKKVLPSKNIPISSSANSAQQRLWAMRGELQGDAMVAGAMHPHWAPDASNIQDQQLNWSAVSPLHYCLMPSMRRLALQLSEFDGSQQVLPIVVGPTGSGKTALASHLRRTLSGSASILTGASGATVANIIKHIALAVGLPVPRMQGTSEANLNALMEQMLQQNKRLTLLVDRADAMPLPGLAALVHLVSAQHKFHCLTITLFGRQGLVERVESLVNQGLQCVKVKPLPVLPLEPREVRMYIHACLRAAQVGFIGMQIPDAVVQRVTRLSQGLPSKVQSLLQTEVVPYLPKPPSVWVAWLLDHRGSQTRALSVVMLVMLMMMMTWLPSEQWPAFSSAGFLAQYVSASDAIVQVLADGLAIIVAPIVDCMSMLI